MPVQVNHINQIIHLHEVAFVLFKLKSYTGHQLKRLEVQLSASDASEVFIFFLKVRNMI